MRLIVKFLATLYDLTGVLKAEVETPGETTVRQLIDVLDAKFAGLKTELLDQEGKLKPMYNVLVNGRAIEWLSGLETRLKDGDEVVFIPPAAGGTGPT